MTTQKEKASYLHSLILIYVNKISILHHKSVVKVIELFKFKIRKLNTLSVFSPINSALLLSAVPVLLCGDS